MDSFLDRRALRVWENEGGAVADATAALMYAVRDCRRETYEAGTVQWTCPNPPGSPCQDGPALFKQKGAFS
jgi:hypothetical protein